MSMLSELQGNKHIRPLDGRAPSVAADLGSYEPQEGDNGLVLLAKLLQRVVDGLPIAAGDIQIGAMELKNAATDDRALVAAVGGTPTFALATLPVLANAAAPTLTEAKLGHLSTDLAGNLRAILATGTNSIGSTKDGGPAWTTVRGASGEPVNSADMTTAAAVTDAPTSGQKLVIDDLLVSTDTAMNVTFLEETSGTVIRGPIYLAANSTTQITLRGLTKLPTVNKKLMCDASAAGNITVEAVYHSEA